MDTKEVDYAVDLLQKVVDERPGARSFINLYYDRELNNYNGLGLATYKGNRNDMERVMMMAFVKFPELRKMAMSALARLSMEETIAPNPSEKTDVNPATTGRPKGNEASFRSKLMVPSSQKEELMELLKGLIHGKKGKGVAIVVKAAEKAGLMNTPSYSELKAVFGEIGSETAFYRGMGQEYENEIDNYLRIFNDFRIDGRTSLSEE